MSKITSYQFISLQESGFVEYCNQINKLNGITCIDFEDSTASDNLTLAKSLKAAHHQHSFSLLAKYQSSIDNESLGFRINSRDSLFFTADVQALQELKFRFHSVFIPKINNAEALSAYFTQLEAVNCSEIIPTIETVEGLQNLEAIVQIKHPRFKRVAFGHCDYNLSLGLFPFIQQTDQRYWEWIAGFAKILQNTDIKFINSPYLQLHDNANFQAIITQLHKIFDSAGQITLNTRQTMLCSEFCSSQHTEFKTDSRSTPKSDEYARQLISNYEKNLVAQKSFAVSKENGHFISPHEYIMARQVLNDR